MNNISFKAKFQISDQRDFSFSYPEMKKSLSDSKDKGQDLLDFIAFIHSDEGKARLDKLPKEDTIELLLFDRNLNGEAVYDPYFYHCGESLPLEKTLEYEYKGLCGKSARKGTLKDNFIQWTDSIIDFLKND